MDGTLRYGGDIVKSEVYDLPASGSHRRLRAFAPRGRSQMMPSDDDDPLPDLIPPTPDQAWWMGEPDEEVQP